MSMDTYPSKNPNTDYWNDVVAGNVAGHSIVHKFGRNASVGTTFVPLSIGGLYLTPQVSGATTLRVKAGNTNDTATGSGARSITLQGLDETGALVSETIPTAGVSAGTASSATFIRLLRAYVETSGTYATTSAGSHAADIVIENGAGGTDWATISVTDFPRSQSEIGCYTIPLGKTGYVKTIEATIQATRTVDVIMLQRKNILETAVPYSALREVKQWTGLSGGVNSLPAAPLGKFPALTDIIFIAKAVATGAGAVVQFEILLIDA